MNEPFGDGTTMDIFDGDIVAMEKKCSSFSSGGKSGNQVELDSATLEKAAKAAPTHSPAPSPSLLPSPKKRGRARRPSVLQISGCGRHGADAVEAGGKDEEIKKVMATYRVEPRGCVRPLRQRRRRG